MSHPKHPLQEVFGYIPQSLHPFICIAGGAAADFEKATDIDLYVMRYNDVADADERREAVLAILEPGRVAKPNAIDLGDFLQESKPYVESSKVIKESHILVRGKPVQVIDTDLKTPAEVLAKFDLSTHAVAYTPDGTWHGTLNLTDTPKLGYVHNPEATWGRYRKICKRYNLPLSFETLVVLFHMKEK